MFQSPWKRSLKLTWVSKNLPSKGGGGKVSSGTTRSSSLRVPARFSLFPVAGGSGRNEDSPVSDRDPVYDDEGQIGDSPEERGEERVVGVNLGLPPAEDEEKESADDDSGDGSGVSPALDYEARGKREGRRLAKNGRWKGRRRKSRFAYRSLPSSRIY